MLALRRMSFVASLLSSIAVACSAGDAGSGYAGSGGATGTGGGSGGASSGGAASHGGSADSGSGAAGEGGDQGQAGHAATAGGAGGSDANEGGAHEGGAQEGGASLQADGSAAADAGTGAAGGNMADSGRADGAAGAGATEGGSEAGPSTCPYSSAPFVLWSGAAPGSTGKNLVEKITERSTDPLVHDRIVDSISKPSLVPFLAAHPNGAAAIIMPGGGYLYETLDKEGIDIATWLNSLGVSAFVLKYRLPTDFPGSPWIPLADAQRAMRTVRDSAAACSIDPARIGVIGFSAGGHLASQLETRFSAATSTSADAIDAIDARPTFSILMYPVVSMDAAIAHSGSKTRLLGTNPTAADIKLYSSELQVTSSTSPTFIGVSNQDTAVNPQNSIRFDNALKAAGVAHELHLYQDGAHGTGIREATGDMADWPKQAAAWLSAHGWLASANR